MKSLHLNRITGISLIMIAMTGCVGTKYLSEGITDEGHVAQENISFPELEDAWQTEGQFPNSENLSKIKPGIAKNELYQLIGRPHFSEAQNAREWDYIMKFYQPDNSVKVCQFKVIFDTQFKGQEFYWMPADCPPQTEKVVDVAPSIEAVQEPVREQITLGADALFNFDKWKPEHMLSQGQNELNELAAVLRQYQMQGQTSVVITGHTDYKGDDAYNMNLSLLRAQTVRNYLINQGVDPNSILATGAGESQPVKQCSTQLSRAEEIECLQPNRRVTLDINVSK